MAKLPGSDEKQVTTRDGRFAASDSIWQECYAQCFQEKRHYDLLSWSIGAAMLAFTSFVIGLIIGLPAGATGLRASYAASVLPVFVIWVWVYERNRVWGEICNEVARDIERRFGIDGLQLRYMRAHLGGTIDRTNSDLPGAQRSAPAGLVPGPSKPLKMRVPSMHYALYILALIVVAAPMALALSG